MGSHRRYNVLHPYTVGFSTKFHRGVKERFHLSQSNYAVAAFCWHSVFTIFETLAIVVFWYCDSIEAGWGTAVTTRPGWFGFTKTVSTANALGVLSVIFLLSFTFGAFYTPSRKSHFLNFNALVELVTSFPFLIVWIGSSVNSNLRNAYVPWFLRIWPLHAHVAYITDFALPVYLRAPFHEVWRLMAAMFTAAGLFHLAENLLGESVPVDYSVIVAIQDSVAQTVASLVNLTDAIISDYNLTSSSSSSSSSIQTATWNISAVENSSSLFDDGVSVAELTACLGNSTTINTNLRTVSFFETIYFTVVTFGTIGYGDVTATNSVSRLVVAIIIIYALYRFPSFFSRMSEHAEAHARTMEYPGNMRGKHCHVVVSGDMDTDMISFALDMFCRAGELVREVDGRKFRVVILSPNEFSQHTQLLINGPIYDARVILLRGDPSSLADLQRAHVGDSLAHFFITRPNLASDQADTATIMQSRLHSLAAPNVPQYIAIRRTENALVIKDRLSLMTTTGIWNQRQQQESHSMSYYYNLKSRFKNWRSSGKNASAYYFSKEQVLASFIDGSALGAGEINSHAAAAHAASSSSSAKNRATLLERDRILFSAIGVACTTPGAVPLLMTLASCATKELNGKQLHPWCDQYEWSLENEVMRCACPSALCGKTFFQIADVFAEFDITVLGFEIVEQVLADEDEDLTTEENLEQQAGFLYGGNSFETKMKKKTTTKEPSSASAGGSKHSSGNNVFAAEHNTNSEQATFGNFFESAANFDGVENDNDDDDDHDDDDETRKKRRKNFSQTPNYFDELMSSSGEDDDADCVAMSNYSSNNKNENKKTSRPQTKFIEPTIDKKDDALEKTMRGKNAGAGISVAGGRYIRGTMRYLKEGLKDKNNINKENIYAQQGIAESNRKNVSFADPSARNALSGDDDDEDGRDDSSNHRNQHRERKRRTITRRRLVLNPRGQQSIANEFTRIILVGVSGESVITAVRNVEENEDAVLALLEIIEKGSKVHREKRYLVSAFLEKIGARNTLDNRNNFVATDKYLNEQKQLKEQMDKQEQMLEQKRKSGTKGFIVPVMKAEHLLSMIRKKKSFAVIDSHRIHRRVISQSSSALEAAAAAVANRGSFSTSNRNNHKDDADDDEVNHSGINPGGNNASSKNATTFHASRLHRAGDLARITKLLVQSSKLAKLKEHLPSNNKNPQQQQQQQEPISNSAIADSQNATLREKKRKGERKNNFLSEDDNDDKKEINDQKQKNNMNRERILGFVELIPRDPQSSLAAFDHFKNQIQEWATDENNKNNQRNIVIQNNHRSNLQDSSNANKSTASSRAPQTVLHQHVLLIDLHSACRQETFTTSANSAQDASATASGGAAVGGGANPNGGSGNASSSTSNLLLVSDHGIIEADRARARKLFSVVRSIMITNPETPVVLLARGAIHKVFAELWSTTNFPSSPFHVQGCALDSFDLKSCRPEDAKGVAIFTTHDGHIDEDFDTMAMLVSRSVEMLRRKKAQVKLDYERMLERAAAVAEAEREEKLQAQEQMMQRRQSGTSLTVMRPSSPSGVNAARERRKSFTSFENTDTHPINVPPSSADRRSHRGSSTGRAPSTYISNNSNNNSKNNITTTVGTTFSHRLTRAQIDLLKSEVPAVTTIISFTQADSTSLLPPFAKPRSLLDDMAQLSHHYVPSFIAGRVLTSQMIESLLYLNFFSTSLLDVVKCMLNIQNFEGLVPEKKRAPISSASPTTNTNQSTEFSSSQPAALDTPAFGIMPIPENCTTWRDVRWNLRTNNSGRQAIALYRLVRAIQSDEELAMIKLQQKRQEQEEEEAEVAKRATAAAASTEEDDFDDCDEELESISNSSDDDSDDEEAAKRRRARRKARKQKKMKHKENADAFGMEGLLLNGKKLSSLAQQQLHQAMLVAASRGFDSASGGVGSNGVTSTGIGSGSGIGSFDNDDEDDEDERDDTENVSRFMLAAKKSYRYRAKLARQAGLHAADSSASSERTLRQDLRFVYLNPLITTELVASDLVFFLY